MPFGFLTENFRISSRKLVAIVLLISSTFVWFFFLDFSYFDIFVNTITEASLIYTGKVLFYGAACISAVLGSLISEKYNRRKFLGLWIIFGVLVAGSLAFFQGVFFFVIVSILLGISLGLGLPSCLAFLADSTNPEERGRVSGIAILITFLLVVPVVAIPSMFGFGIITVIVLCLLKGIGFFALFIDPIDREPVKMTSWKSLFVNRNFRYYILPWLLVNIADGLRLFIWGNFQQFPDFDNMVRLGYTIRYLGVGFFGLLAGVLADRIGRKKPIYVAVVLMGISFAFLGYISTLSLFLFLVISGVGWSFLFVVNFSLFGDIAYERSKERYYSLGWVTPIAILMGFSSLSGVFQFDAPVDIVSIFLSIVLFLGIIPVFFAQETLAESSIRKREIKKHMEKIGKLISESKKKE